MKTKQVPALVTLTAAFAMCIISYVNDFSLSFLIRTMFLVVIGFYILGCVIKIILDRNMSQMDEEITAQDLGFADGEIIPDMEFVEEEKEIS